MTEKNCFAHLTAVIDKGCEINKGVTIWHFSMDKIIYLLRLVIRNRERHDLPWSIIKHVNLVRVFDLANHKGRLK